MNPYSKPGERKIGAHKPRVLHVAPDIAKLSTVRERQIEKERIWAARRAIKKSARRHLQQELEKEIEARFIATEVTAELAQRTAIQA